MEDALLGCDDFVTVAKQLKEDYGVAADDSKESNEKLQSWIDEFGDVNFYTCMTLLILSPEDFKSCRSQLKMFLLPAFQILVPFGMVWYFLVEKQMIVDNGYCCDHDNIIFRFTGFVTFMYSAWQIIDGCSDASSMFFVNKAVEVWSMTGNKLAFKATWMFYLCYLSQQACSMLLLIVTYVIYTSQCDTPLDLLMNCVAVNFVLDIDSEWMDSGKQDMSVKAASFLFREWRDMCTKNEAEVKNNMACFRSLRRAAPKLVDRLAFVGYTMIWVSAYVMVFGWTFCPKEF